MFLDFCDRQRIVPVTEKDIDEAMGRFISFLWQKGHSLSVAAAAVFGISHIDPHLRSHLHLSRRMLKGWARREPSVQRPPMTPNLAALVAVSIAEAGHVGSGLATAVACATYMRISEFCGIVSRDVDFDRKTGLATIRLARTKTGLNQSVVVRDLGLSCLLRSFLRTAPDSKPLFGVSPAKYRSLFAAACDRLQLGSIGFTPHSLRHGGATFDYSNGTPLEDILHRGRWAVSKSAKTYVQAGRALLIAASVPGSILKLADEVFKHFSHVFTSFLPPS